MIQTAQTVQSAQAVDTDASGESGEHQNIDFRALLRQVRGAGLLDRRPGYYRAKIGLTLFGLAVGWVALLVVGNSWLTLLVAAYLGFMFTQVVFLGHDAGHQQIFESRRANKAVGLLVGNLLTGLSFGWWLPKHQAHHAHPNEEGRDPDIGAGAIAFTAAHTRARRGLARVAARHQAALFFPMLCLEAVGLHVSSVQTLRRKTGWSARLEALLIGVNAVAYLGALFWVLSPVKAVVFFAVHQALFGFYLGCSFTPNHTGMPIVEPATTTSFAARQVLTARNVRGGRLITFLLGGLDFQIEHHLFPTMPRPNLGRVQPLVKAFCREHGLSWSEATLLGSYREALRHLRSIGSGHGRDPLPGQLPAGASRAMVASAR